MKKSVLNIVLSLYSTAVLSQNIIQEKKSNYTILFQKTVPINETGESAGNLSMSFKNKPLTYILGQLLTDYDIILHRNSDKPFRENFDVKITVKEADSLPNLKYKAAIKVLDYYKISYKIDKSKRTKWVLNYNNKGKAEYLKRDSGDENILEITKNKTYRAYEITGEQLSKSLGKILSLNIGNNIKSGIKVSAKINDITAGNIFIINELESNFGLIIKQKQIYTSTFEIY